MRSEDVALIEAFLDGDEGAFTKLVKKHQKSVHALAWRKVGDFHVAEEITQDVFVKVYHKLSTLKNPSQFSGWLSVMTHRQCIAWHRENRVPMQSLEAMEPVELEEHYYTEHLAAERRAAVAARKREAVQQILRSLPESERTVVTLHYLGEMSCEEVGEYLGISPNTVKSRLHRARKRLEGEVDALREVLEDFQLRATLTGDILRAVARVKPVSPSGGKPFLPWAVSLSTAVLLILMAGFGVQHLFRFQQPYSFDASSAMTVEIVDAPVRFALQAKPAIRTRLGTTAEPGERVGVGSRTDSLLATVTPVDEEPRAISKPRWHQTNGPSGGAFITLFSTSDSELYAVGGGSLFKLAADGESWLCVNSDLPSIGDVVPIAMAERGDTLYLACEKELVASTDGGKTWRAVGYRPKGRVVALLIADEAFYLVFRDGIFRSKDAGKTWYPQNRGLAHPLQSPDMLTGDALFSAAVVGNRVLVGTSQGLYRLNGEVWESLPVAESRRISSIAVTDSNVYISTEKLGTLFSGSVAFFCSTDAGHSWHEITPPQSFRFSSLAMSRFKLVAIGETVLALGSSVFRSTDRGKTWANLGFHGRAFTLPMFPAVALDENSFFLAGPRGISCSIDGGYTWRELMNGIVQTRVLSVLGVNNVLYAASTEGIFQSANRGESWTKVPVAGLPSHFEGRLGYPRIVAANGTLYVQAHHLTETCLLALVPDSQVLMPVLGIPVFGTERAEYVQRLRGNTEMFSGTGLAGKTWANRTARPHRAGNEHARPGAFAVSGETFYLADEQSIFRWSPGASEWHNTGLGNIRELHRDDYGGFHLAASGAAVYVEGSNGYLFRSVDRGDNWEDVTASLPVAFESVSEIVLAGSRVFVATNAGVVMSSDGENWHALTDATEVPIVMHNIALDGSCVCGVSDEGIYRLKNGTLTWEQVASDVPERMTSFVVDSGVFYIGTEDRGVLRLQSGEPRHEDRQVVLARP
ncbi:hypothetical protein C6495_08415 [Candidatus Poribacteria bacterium]|nr:MAG: hypothetical protein C6495_08415 [Candidatus Poribacteria bacterium]